MMKKLLSCAFASIALFAGTSNLLAQGFKPGVLAPEVEGGFLIGPIGGVNLVTYGTQPFATLQSEPTCFMAQNGSGVAPFGGISAELPLGTGMKNFIMIEAIFDSKSSAFTSDNSSRSGVPTKINGNVQPGEVTTSVNADLTYLLLNAGYKYNFTEGTVPVGPGLSALAVFGFKLASRLNKTVTVSAANSSGSGIASSTVTSSQDLPSDQVNSIRLAIRGQFTWDIALSLDWIATPTVGYDLPLTKVDNGTSTMKWSASGAYAGVAVRYMIR
jgi:hypothetical protein